MSFPFFKIIITIIATGTCALKQEELTHEIAGAKHPRGIAIQILYAVKLFLSATAGK